MGTVEQQPESPWQSQKDRHKAFSACGSVRCAKRKCHERRLVGAMHADDFGLLVKTEEELQRIVVEWQEALERNGL